MVVLFLLAILFLYYQLQMFHSVFGLSYFRYTFLLLFLLLLQSWFYLFYIIFIFLLPEVFNNSQTFLPKQLINFFIQLNYLFFVSLPFLFLLFSKWLQLPYLLHLSAIQFVIFLTAVFLKNYLHFCQTLKVFLYCLAFGFVVDQSFSDKFTQLIYETLSAYKDVKTIFSLGIWNSVSFCIVFEEKAKKFP